MNLIIDQGNSFVKIAVFDKDSILAVYQKEELQKSFIDTLRHQYSIQRGILSTVKEIDKDLVEYLHHKIAEFRILSHETRLPFRIAYKTPETLGRDRIAAIAGAYSVYPNRNCLVIDAGTAVTYDFINDKGIYLGGNIAPGIDLRFRSLSQFTGKLPLVSVEGEIPLLGDNTQTAIRSGVIQGLTYEMEGYIAELQDRYSDLLIFLTGGSGKYFEDRLKYPIFADNNIVLKGLNSIIEYNAKL
ncbi:MAG: type III pantothenate kinase [Bacteroidales bacterium]